MTEEKYAIPFARGQDPLPSALAALSIIDPFHGPNILTTPLSSLFEFGFIFKVLYEAVTIISS